MAVRFFTKALILSTCMTIGSVFVASAQDSQTDNHIITVVVPNVALLDLETSAAKNFTVSFAQPTPLEAGERITAPDNNTDLWLNYSSIVAGNGTRKVNVKVSELIPGVDIKVIAGSATTGFGTKGTPTAIVTLTTADQEIISAIGSVYTESGPSKGHQLTYSFVAEDANYASLRAASKPVTVTYTLADN